MTINTVTRANVRMRIRLKAGRVILADEGAGDHVLAQRIAAVHSFPELKAVIEGGMAAAFGFSDEGGVARSQPPAGSGTAMASGGCPSITKFLTASCAVASVLASR